MSKFAKRISKLSRSSPQNALIIGEGFGFISEILTIFQTVFVIDENYPKIKAKNLVYKEDYIDLHLLVDVSHIFLDLSKINEINLIMPVFTRWKSFVIIEGNEPIGRDFTQTLYHHGWKCTSTSGFFHTWELK